MQKWEYKIVLRRRSVLPPKKDDKYWEGEMFATLEGKEWNQINFDKHLEVLGEEGWELVTCIALSSKTQAAYQIYGSFIGGSGHIDTGVPANMAGFTSHEKWVFKRPKE